MNLLQNSWRERGQIMACKVIENLAIETYHNGSNYIDFWSSSNIKTMLKSPKHAHFEKYNAEHKDSAAKDFGTLIHDFLDSKVRGVEFDRTVFYPPINQKTGEAYGSATKKYLDARMEAGGKNSLMSEGDDKALKAIWYNLTNCKYQSRIIEHIIKYGTPEVSIFAESDGIKYKIRPDVLVGGNTPKIIDWKSTADISLEGIQKAIQNYKYDISAAMYQYIEHERTGIWKPFIWVFIENVPPYDFLVVDASPYAFSIEKQGGENIIIPNVGAHTFLTLKKQLEECIKTEYYPGVASRIKPNFESTKRSGKRIAKLQPSNWYNNNLIEFFK